MLENLKADLDRALSGDEQAKLKFFNYCYRYSLITPYKEEIKKIFEFLSRTEHKQNPYAMVLQGDFYCFNFLGKENLEKAVRLYSQSAKSGNSWGQCHLGRCYHLGRGVQKNNKAAAELYQLAMNSSKPYVVAFRYMGELLRDMGGPGSLQQAKSLFLEGIRRGSEPGCYIGLLQAQNDCNWGWLCDPFVNYIPDNLDFSYSIVANKRTKISGDAYYVGSEQVIDNYTISITYTGTLNIGERVVYSRTMPNFYSEIYDEFPYSSEVGDCCYSKSDHMKRKKLVGAYAVDKMTPFLQSTISEGVEIIRRRVSGVGMTAGVRVDPEAFSQEQLAALIAHLQRGGSIYQAEPSGQSALSDERQPLLRKQ